jgi:phosphopantetheinyl transferase (holo-ACP synthase)
MVGNDVVDLADPDTARGATHPRFDERVFAAEERAWLGRNRAEERLRWVLWAAKESAFKALKKLDPRAIFSPHRLIVRLETASAGSVRYGERLLTVGVKIDRGACHAVTSIDVEPRAIIVSGMRCLTADVAEEPRPAARAFAIHLLAPLLRATERDLAVVSERRVPRLHIAGRPAPVDLSLSHHGRFVAFACALGPEIVSRFAA